MTARHFGLTRRHDLAADRRERAWCSAWANAQAQMATIRQGYQTNIWGMPTYYLMKSGALEKRGIKTEDFAVPSGNLTMQQMVARQVDMGTYAGPVVHHRPRQGRPGRHRADRDRRHDRARWWCARTSASPRSTDLKGKKIANQTGSSIGNIFVDQVGPANGLKKGDFQEVRMDVNNMIAAMAAKTVDAMVNVEPYNAIAEAEGIGTIDHGLFQRRQDAGVHGGDARLRREEPGRRSSPICKAWREVAARLQEQPEEGVGRDLHVLHLEGLQHVQRLFSKALAASRSNPGFPTDLEAYMQQHAEVLLQEKKISAMPDWKKALRTDFMGQGERLTS